MEEVHATEQAELHPLGRPQRSADASDERAAVPFVEREARGDAGTEVHRDLLGPHEHADREVERATRGRRGVEHHVVGDDVVAVGRETAGTDAGREGDEAGHDDLRDPCHLEGGDAILDETHVLLERRHAPGEGGEVAAERGELHLDGGGVEGVHLAFEHRQAALDLGEAGGLVGGLLAFERDHPRLEAPEVAAELLHVGLDGLRGVAAARDRRARGARRHALGRGVGHGDRGESGEGEQGDELDHRILQPLVKAAN